MTPALRLDDRISLTGLARALGDAQRLLVDLFADELAGVVSQPLTYEDFVVLSLLSEHDGGLPMNELIDAVRMPGPSTTRLIDRLVAANLVQRAPDEADRRRVIVKLTVRGRSAQPRLRAAEDRVHERVQDIWGARAAGALLRAVGQIGVAGTTGAR